VERLLRAGSRVEAGASGKEHPPPLPAAAPVRDDRRSAARARAADPPLELARRPVEQASWPTPKASADPPAAADRPWPDRGLADSDWEPASQIAPEVDVRRLTDHVIQAIDRRLIADRERRGR
jgi:hypothetical protein